MGTRHRLKAKILGSAECVFVYCCDDCVWTVKTSPTAVGPQTENGVQTNHDPGDGEEMHGDRKHQGRLSVPTASPRDPTVLAATRNLCLKHY